MSDKIAVSATARPEGGILANFPRSARAIAMVAALAAACSPPPVSATNVGRPATATSTSATTRQLPAELLGLIFPTDVLASHPEGYLSQGELKVLLPGLAADLAYVKFEGHASLLQWRRDHPNQAAKLIEQISSVRRTLTLVARDSQAPFRTDAKAVFDSLGQVSDLLKNGDILGHSHPGDSWNWSTDNSNGSIFVKAIADLEWYAHCLEGK